MTNLDNAKVVRLANWTNSYCTIGNIFDEYAKHVTWLVGMAKAGQNAPVSSMLNMVEYIERNRRNGGDDAWSVYAGACITNQPGYYERERAIYESAVVVNDGDIVEYCGRKWKVKVLGRKNLNYPEYSNPLKFVEVVESAQAAE